MSCNRHGVATYTNNSKYEGDFENDGRHGWGVQEFGNGQRYEGEWTEDKIHGMGRWEYSADTYFEGEWKNGVRVKGRLVGGGQEYEGEWSGEQRSGRGMLIIPGVLKYEGEWKDDVQHGFGTCQYADGSKYTGEWKGGKRHGTGILTSAVDGSTTVSVSYTGGWENDVPHGLDGTQLEASGERYVGGFERGLRHGFGKCAYPDGTKYQGDWKEGKRHGVGTCAYANGDVYKGEWARDCRHGHGSCIFADGTRFKGRWEDDGWVQSAASPTKSKVGGAGVTRAVAGRRSSFMILAKDEDGNRRLSGGDEFQVHLVLRQPPTPAVTSIVQAACSSPVPTSNGRPTVVGTVKDNDDGSYSVEYLATVAGVYDLMITTGSAAEPVADSPYPLRVVPGGGSLRKCIVQGEGRSQARCGELTTFEILVFDEHGSRCDDSHRLVSQPSWVEEMLVEATLEGGGGGGEVEVDIEALGSEGRLLCRYTAPKTPGLYRLHCSLKGKPLPGTPHSVSIVASDVVSTKSPTLCETSEESHDNGVIHDSSSIWEAIAAAAYRADGDETGWDSDEEISRKAKTAEDSYLESHPDVPVVENLEDLWLVSKLQRERKKKEEAEKAQRLGTLKSRLESEFGPGQPPPSVEEAKAVMQEILKSEKSNEDEDKPGKVVYEQPTNESGPSRGQAQVDRSWCVRNRSMTVAAAAQLDEVS